MCIHRYNLSPYCWTLEPTSLCFQQIQPCWQFVSRIFVVQKGVYWGLTSLPNSRIYFFIILLLEYLTNDMKGIDSKCQIRTVLPLYIQILLKTAANWGFFGSSPSYYPGRVIETLQACKKYISSPHRLSCVMCHVFKWKNLTCISLCFFFIIINIDHSLV